MVVETDAELDFLPDGTMVWDARPEVMKKVEGQWFVYCIRAERGCSSAVDLPALVLGELDWIREQKIKR
jgi:hypothetical protein